MANESQICEDWINEFPCLARYKNGRKLLRIQNPVVLGIELEKFLSDEYRPRFVALNLLSRFPGFSVSHTLRTSRGFELSIRYSKHEMDFQRAALGMRDAYPFLAGDGVVGPEVLIDIYRLGIQRIFVEAASPLAVWFSLIQLLKFFGRDTEALVERTKLAEYVRTLNPGSLAMFGDFDAFLKQELDSTADEFEKRRRANIAKANWNILPGWINAKES